MCWVGQPSSIYRSGPSAEPLTDHSTPEYLSGVGRMPKLLGALLEIGNQLFVCVVPVGRYKLGVLAPHGGVGHCLQLLLFPPLWIKTIRLVFVTHTVSLHYQAQCLYIGGISRFLSRPKIVPAL